MGITFKLCFALTALLLFVTPEICAGRRSPKDGRADEKNVKKNSKDHEEAATAGSKAQLGKTKKEHANKVEHAGLQSPDSKPRQDQATSSNGGENRRGNQKVSSKGNAKGISKGIPNTGPPSNSSVVEAVTASTSKDVAAFLASAISKSADSVPNELLLGDSTAAIPEKAQKTKANKAKVSLQNDSVVGIEGPPNTGPPSNSSVVEAVTTSTRKDVSNLLSSAISNSADSIIPNKPEKTSAIQNSEDAISEGNANEADDNDNADYVAGDEASVNSALLPVTKLPVKTVHVNNTPADVASDNITTLEVALAKTAPVTVAPVQNISVKPVIAENATKADPEEVTKSNWVSVSKLANVSNSVKAKNLGNLSNSVKATNSGNVRNSVKVKNSGNVKVIKTNDTKIKRREEIVEETEKLSLKDKETQSEGASKVAEDEDILSFPVLTALRMGAVITFASMLYLLRFVGLQILNRLRRNKKSPSKCDSDPQMKKVASAGAEDITEQEKTGKSMHQLSETPQIFKDHKISTPDGPRANLLPFEKMQSVLKDYKFTSRPRTTIEPGFFDNEGEKSSPHQASKHASKFVEKIFGGGKQSTD